MKTLFIPYIKSKYNEVNQNERKAENRCTWPYLSAQWAGVFSPVSLLVRTTAGISLSQFFILQAIMATMVLLTEIPLGKLTDRIGYKSTLVLYQIALLISRTPLLLAHVSCNYSLFILQAILEGTAASFSSGTQSGYIYIMFSKEHYAEKSAHVANYGTVGFLPVP